MKILLMLLVLVSGINSQAYEFGQHVCIYDANGNRYDGTVTEREVRSLIRSEVFVTWHAVNDKSRVSYGWYNPRELQNRDCFHWEGREVSLTNQNGYFRGTVISIDHAARSAQVMWHHRNSVPLQSIGVGVYPIGKLTVW